MTTPARERLDSAQALAEIQGPVKSQLDAVGPEMWRIVAEDNPLVTDVNSHLMGMRGKLFRPTLLLLAANAEGTPDSKSVTMAAVAELIHLATLVHDDAVDHSVLRRGMPTVNSLYSHQVSIIFGDFLYSRALLALVQAGEIEALGIFAAVTNELTLGEIRQLAAIDALAFSEDDYYALIRAKTASLMRAACEVGALCGAESHRTALAKYGERLGMAFQVADDLIDYTETQSITGKPSGNDLREHKVTLPLIHALTRMTPAARARVDALFASKEPQDGDIAEVIGIVTEAGGIEYARRWSDRFAIEAEESLAALPETPAKAALLESIGYVMERRW